MNCNCCPVEPGCTWLWFKGNLYLVSHVFSSFVFPSNDSVYVSFLVLLHLRKEPKHFWAIAIQWNNRKIAYEANLSAKHRKSLNHHVLLLLCDSFSKHQIKLYFFDFQEMVHPKSRVSSVSRFSCSLQLVRPLKFRNTYYKKTKL